MENNSRRGNLKPDEQAALEAYLRDNMGRVAPRPEFVDNLHHRLRYSDLEETSSSNLIQLLLFALLALSSSILLVIAGIKAVMALLVALGVLHQVKEPPPTERKPVVILS